MNQSFKRLFAVVALAFCVSVVSAHGAAALPAVARFVFIAFALLAGSRGYLRGQLGAAPDTNDLAAELNLSDILNSAISSFKRAILPVTMFATTFRDVQLMGTDKVEVPYYPLQGIKSKDFNGVYDFSTGAGSKTDKREISITSRKYQPIAFTGRDLARLPMLDATRLGQLKGEKLAYDIIQDILSIVTAANFPSIAFTGLPSTFDSDDVVDIRTACNKNQTGLGVVTDGATTTGSVTLTSASATFSFNDIGVFVSGAGIPAGAYINGVTNATTILLSAPATATAAGVTVTLARPMLPWPETGRGLLVNPDYDGALLKDNVFSQAYSIGTTSAIQEGRLPNVFGFNYGHSAAIPTNGQNLVGMAAYMSAILAAFSPIPPPPAVREVMTQYEIVTDPDTGISIEYRAWGDPNSDTEKRVIECNYGFALGESMALKRIVSA